MRSKNARPTLKDIATAVGVSPTAVSLVLNHREIGSRVSPERVEAIRRTARQMGYFPDLNARRMRLSGGVPQHMTLAILAAREMALELVGPLVRGVDLHLENTRHQREISVATMIETFAPGRLVNHPAFNGRVQFHGAILANTAPADHAFLREQELPAPLVFFMRRLRGHSHVISSDYDDGRAALRLFLEMGRQRPALLAPALPTQIVKARCDGFLREANEAGVETDTIRAEEYGGEAAHGATAAYLGGGGGADAVFAAGDPMAMGALHAFKQAGRRTPDDIAIVGHDDHEAVRFLDPPLTTFRVPRTEMAQVAAEIMTRILLDHCTETVRRVFPCRLMLRASTGHDGGQARDVTPTISE